MLEELIKVLSVGVMVSETAVRPFKSITILQLHETTVGRRGVEMMFVFQILCHIFCVYAEFVLSVQE